LIDNPVDAASKMEKYYLILPDKSDEEINVKIVINILQ
jgi:hypothetical protein